MTSLYFYCILFTKRNLQGSAHTVEEGIAQGCEHQEGRIMGDHSGGHLPQKLNDHNNNNDWYLLSTYYALGTVLSTFHIKSFIPRTTQEDGSVSLIL